MEREVQPEALDRIATLVRKTVDMGDKQALVVAVPLRLAARPGARDHQPRHGLARASSTASPKRAYDFFKRELEPRGFQIRAEILNWPGGMPGRCRLLPAMEELRRRSS